MKKYTIDEGSFELPEEWRDNSVNIFVVGGSEPPMQLSFVISRDTLRQGTELVDYVEKQISDVSKKLKKFRVIGKRQIEVSGRPALEAEFTWVSDQTPMHQLQQYVCQGDRILAFTATAPIKIADEHIEQIGVLMRSLLLNV